MGVQEGLGIFLVVAAVIAGIIWLNGRKKKTTGKGKGGGGKQTQVK
jgi:hypothetical protein